jgi:hypothetical protein
VYCPEVGSSHTKPRAVQNSAKHYSGNLCSHGNLTNAEDIGLRRLNGYDRGQLGGGYLVIMVLSSASNHPDSLHGSSCSIMLPGRSSFSAISDTLILSGTSLLPVRP